MTERAAVIYSPSLSLSASLSLLTVVGSPCHCELLALLFSVHETGREEAVVLFFLSPASSNLHTGGYLKAASTRALTMSAISGSKVPGNHMLYPPIMTSECPQDDGAAPLLCSFNFCNTSKCPVEIIQFWSSEWA